MICIVFLCTGELIFNEAPFLCSKFYIDFNHLFKWWNFVDVWVIQFECVFICIWIVFCHLLSLWNAINKNAMFPDKVYLFQFDFPMFYPSFKWTSCSLYTSSHAMIWTFIHFYTTKALLYWELVETSLSNLNSLI